MTTETLLSRCLTDQHLLDAWNRVQANGGCAGVDGLEIEMLRPRILDYLAGLRGQLERGDYRPQALLGVPIPKASGKMRQLAIPCLGDRILQTAVARVLGELLDPSFDPASFAYRPGRSVRQAITRVKTCHELGLAWVVDADIRDYFDTIHHLTLLAALRRQLPDGSLTPVLAQWLAAPVLLDGALQIRRKGVPQGAPLSPLLANLYLSPLDAALGQAGHSLVRYADDFLVLCPNRAQAMQALEIVTEVLGELRLTLNEEKTRITHFEAGFRFLGVRFEGYQISPVEAESARWLLPPGQENLTLPDAPTDLPLPAEHALAQPAADECTDSDEDTILRDLDAVHLEPEHPATGQPRSVYVTSPGLRLYKRGSQLLVKKGIDEVARLPLGTLDQIVVHGPCLVSTSLIQHCRSNHVALSFADTNGVDPVIMDTAPELNLRLLRAQVSRSADPQFNIMQARACIEGKLHNSVQLLHRFERADGPDTVPRAISILERCRRQLPLASGLLSLRGYEGRAARAYFAALASLLPPEWGFTGRNRQPPRDPINALLSYGYAVLFHTLEALVRRARLHPGFGHLHTPQQGYQALVCDLMEEFRPLAVDAVVLTLARKHSLDPERDFTPNDDGASLMSHAAKQLLIARLQAALGRPVAGTGDPDSLYIQMQRQIRNYARSLDTDGPAYQAYLAA